MFEQEAIYNLITYVGNIEGIEPPLPLYSLKAGVNNDSWKKYLERKKAYEALIQKRDRWFAEIRVLSSFIPVNYSVGNWSIRKRKSLAFMLNSDKWIDVFLNEMFGSAKAAFWKTETSEELKCAYILWFDSKRKELREKMQKESTDIINRDGKSITKIGKPSAPHGGVANLLKVLTKTMEKQGSDIQSIAKVQYTICMQAGIYIPEEFIEDVAVILNAENEL